MVGDNVNTGADGQVQNRDRRTVAAYTVVEDVRTPLTGYPNCPEGLRPRMMFMRDERAWAQR